MAEQAEGAGKPDTTQYTSWRKEIHGQGWWRRYADLWCFVKLSNGGMWRFRILGYGIYGQRYVKPTDSPVLYYGFAKSCAQGMQICDDFIRANPHLFTKSQAVHVPELSKLIGACR